MQKTIAQQLFVLSLLIPFSGGCGQPGGSSSIAANSSAPVPWLGIPSAVNQVIIALHDGTGWLLNKSQVAIRKAGDVRVIETNGDQCLADFHVSVQFAGETFETTAKDVPCDKDGIPTEAAIDRLRHSVEDIKTKMKRLQN
jgi:hypothetical protein